MLDFLKKFLKKRNHGSVMVEFAFCIPIVTAILYYTMDTPRYARLYGKTKFIGHAVANMFQRVTQARGNKIITKADVANIIKASYAMMPLDRVVVASSGLSVYNEIMLHCIKTDASCKAKVAWQVVCNPTGYWSDSLSSRLAQQSISTVNYSAGGAVPSAIYPGLQMSPNSIKIIVESYVATDSDVRKKLGFYLLSPKNRTHSPTIAAAHSVVIFTPAADVCVDTSPPR